MTSDLDFLESTGNYFQGFGEQAHSFGDLGRPAKKQKKKFTLKEKPSFRLIFPKNSSVSGGSPQAPPWISKYIYFHANMLI